MVELRISRLDRLDSPPVPVVTTWAALAAELTAPQRRAEQKQDVGLWVPAEFAPGGGRRASAAVSVGVGVVDVDGAPLDALALVSERLRSLGCAAVVHSSYRAALVWPSHTKFRVVIPLAEPVEPRRWREAWTRMVLALAPEFADRQCSDAVHAYYLPSAPIHTQPGFQPWAFELQGPPLDVWSLPAAPSNGRGALAPPTRPARLEDLRDVLRTWRGAKSRGRIRMVRALEALIKGDPYAGEGERDSVTFQLSMDLTRELLECTPESLAALFGPSLAVMGRGAPTVELVTQKCDAARRRISEETEEAPETPTGEPWILVSSVGSAYWFRDSSGWVGPYAGEAVDVGLRVHLAHAVALGEVSLLRPGQAGGPPTPRSRGELAQQYGRPILEHEIEIGAERTTVEPLPDSAGMRIVEAAARVRPYVAQRSPIVAEYLDRLCPPGKVREDVNTWLSVLPDLREPIAALVPWGLKGAGKSLFALGCSRIWTEGGPTPALDALEHYNGGLLRCPLVFADEGLPRLRSGGDVTALLRERIQARSHVIRRKYLSDVEAKGALRIIVAANNDRVLGKFDEHLRPEDLAALAERFYTFRVRDECAEWLAYDPQRGAAIVAQFANHVWFLAATTKKEKRSRFWISGTDETARSMAVRGGLRSELCRWVVAFLERPAGVSFEGCSVEPTGKIRLSTRGILATWDLVLKEVNTKPRASDLVEALRVIATPVRTAAGRFWEIDTRSIDQWISDMEWGPDAQALVTAYERRGLRSA